MNISQRQPDCVHSHTFARNWRFGPFSTANKQRNAALHPFVTCNRHDLHANHRRVILDTPLFCIINVSLTFNTVAATTFFQFNQIVITVWNSLQPNRNANRNA
jgi:hypothetical protein